MANSDLRNAANATVLVVDDTESNLDLAQVLFEELQCHVLTAGDGYQALALVQQYSVDMIFMDIQLPRMGGCEVARRIHALGPAFERIPIIAMTAGTLDERASWEAAGMVDYVGKPVDWDQLQQVFARHIPTGEVTIQGAATGHGQPGEEIGIHGLDWASGLSRFRDVSLLLNSLRKFSEEFTSIGDSLRRARHNGECGVAERLGHKLKGSAANLGLKKLADLGNRIEDSCKHRGTLPNDELIKEVDREISLLIASIPARPTNTDAVEKTALTEADWREILTGLQASLFVDLHRAKEWLERLATAEVGSAHRGTCGRIFAYFDDFKIDELNQLLTDELAVPRG